MIENINADEKIVTAILENKRVLATQKDLSQIKGAVRLYENLDEFDYKSEKDLLKAHKILMHDVLKMQVGIETQVWVLEKYQKLHTLRLLPLECQYL